jgi:transposase-like protein
MRLTEARWEKARQQYETSDASLAAVAESVGVSRQAVSVRAKKEQWSKKLVDIVDDLSLTCSKPTAGSQLGKRSDENIAVIIDTFALTGNKSMACRQVGIDESTLRRWAEAEPELALTMTSAREAHLIGQYRKIAEAKDWKAAAQILARSPETRDVWGEVREKGPQIILNIHRDEVIIEQ